MYTMPKILNDKGEPVVLNAEERHNCKWLANQAHAQHGTKFFNGLGIKNSLGYEIAITTLTTIAKKISEQKFFEVAPADYLPVVVGQGAWSSNLTTYRSFAMSGLFEDGIINQANGSSRLASSDAGVDSVNILIQNWANQNTWSLFELEQASKSGNWDVVSAKEKSRKLNWDLGVQRVAFLGANGLNGAGGSCLGLLNLPGITFNSTLITKSLKSMSTSELGTFQQNAIEAFRSNCNRTAFPTHFTIPESDYNGLASQSSVDFPIKSKLQLLEEAFQVITRNSAFKILPLAYCDVANSGGLLSKQTYVFLKYDEESMNMQIPLPYTNTVANSINNFQFQNVGFGQFSGVQALRPLEILYAGYTP